MRIEMGEGVEGLCLNLRNKIEYWSNYCEGPFARRVAGERQLELEVVIENLYVEVARSLDGLAVNIVGCNGLTDLNCELDVILTERIVERQGRFDFMG